MPFDGMDRLRHDALPATGGWVKLIDDQPVRLTVLGYVGKFESKKFPGRFAYRFAVHSDGGISKSLDCTWRLSQLLHREAERAQQPFTVTIVQHKEVAVITKSDGSSSKQLVNVYTVSDIETTPSRREGEPTF